MASVCPFRLAAISGDQPSLSQALQSAPCWIRVLIFSTSPSMHASIRSSVEDIQNWMQERNLK
jgi:hypothetical protein